MGSIKKQGALARIGLFVALAAMFGEEQARLTYSRRAEERRHGGGHAHYGRRASKARPSGSGRSGTKKETRPGRAGFKLVKKMARQRSTPLMPDKLYGPAKATARRKARRRLERQIKRENWEAARRDFFRIAREYRYCTAGQR